MSGRHNAPVERAAVLIGVSRIRQLPWLPAVLPSILDMQQWVDEQGFKPAVTLTDEGQKLTAAQIFQTIDRILQDGPPEQLIVYFAGHGVNLGRREYWLLSDAPRNSNEAVNVAGSAQLARTCGIGHVVFIADACRTAATGIGMQSITGQEIFPQVELDFAPRPVDLFYATRLGNPAYEHPDPEGSAERFSAVYTTTLLEALRGRPRTVLEWEDGADPPVGVVRPWPLSDHLEEEVARRAAALDRAGAIVQIPESIITSRPTAWLARLTDPPPPPPAAPRQVVALPAQQHVAALARDALREVLGGADDDTANAPPQEAHDKPRRRRRPRRRAWRWLGVAASTAATASAMGVTAPVTAAAAVTAAAVAWYASARRSSATFGPDQVETGCGIKIEGAEVVSAESPGTDVEIVGAAGELIHVHKRTGVPATVLLRFRDGTSVLLPALDDFLGAVRIENDELFEISYEPSRNSRRFADGRAHLDLVRSLRTLLLNCRQYGVLRMTDDQAESLAKLVGTGIGIDPSLAVLAGYAFHDLHRDDLLQTLLELLDRDPGVAPFDVALLAGGLTGEADRALAVPMVPLLAEGWALLEAFRVPLPPQVLSLREHLVPSMWTHIDPSGFEQARAALRSTGGFR